jgi:hypothetical protein
MAEINRPVFMSGENPGMTLYFPGTEQPAAIASYWVCTDSPHGVGHALVLWCYPEAIPGMPDYQGDIFTDNILLARILVEKLTRHFPEFEGTPVESLPYTQADNLAHTYDGKNYQVRCQTADFEIQAEWHTPLDRKQLIWPGFPAGDASFDLTNIICPCRAGRITINGQPVNGEVLTGENAEGRLSSTAFLAFAETWVGPL